MDATDYTMDHSLPRLESLLRNIHWDKEDLKKLFIALVKRFQWPKQQTVDFDTWMAKMLHTVEIHKIDSKNASKVIDWVSDSKFDSNKLLNLIGEDKDKGLDNILEDLSQQEGVDIVLIAKVRKIVSAVDSALKLGQKQCLKDEMESILFDLCKAVEVKTKANKTNGWKPRITQMVSWCILALSESSYLLQVGTGEGKSCIVAMFAAYRARKGQKVDVISSSPVLAERDAEAWKIFYNKLGLKVGCNNNLRDEALKECYKCHIVYGTTDSFAGDWLRHHFLRRKVRGAREFQCVIVDEVDSLLLDKGLEMVYVSSEMPAMQRLNIILSQIWSEVSQHTKLDCGKTIGPIQSIQIPQEDTDIFTDREKLFNLVEQKIRNNLRFTCPEVTPEDSPITGFQHFVQSNLRLWVQNAFKATEMALGDEYIIQGETVVPVDCQNTGVVQNNRQWNDGLQQFMEMKHQTKVSDMAFITNFMSNVKLFMMYEHQVFGISGTLGNKEEIKMLQELYKGMKTCSIPYFRRKKLFEEEGKVLNEEGEWLEAIYNAVHEKVNSTCHRGERAVLVICGTINHAETIKKVITEYVTGINVKSYTDSNMDPSEITGRPLQARDVIVATNLAGRGTDLQVSDDVNKAGGLFVIQTFLPLNTRVEQQAFGRTARQGNPGSAQLIMCASHLQLDIRTAQRPPSEVLMPLKEDHHTQSFEKLTADLDHLLFDLETQGKTNVTNVKETRDNLVRERLSSYLKTDIPKMTKKEDLFSDYLKLINYIHEKHKKSKMLNAIVESMHECWGIWLLTRFNENESKENLKRMFNEAMEYAQKQLEKGISPSSAVSFYIRYGNDLRLQGSLRESVKMYSRAIDADDQDLIALLNHALSLIKQKDSGYVNAAFIALKKAGESVEHIMNFTEEMVQNVTKTGPGPPTRCSTYFIKQQDARLQVLKCLKRNINVSANMLMIAYNNGMGVKITECHYSFPVDMQMHLNNVLDELRKLYLSGWTQLFSLELTFSLTELLSRLGC